MLTWPCTGGFCRTSSLARFPRAWQRLPAWSSSTSHLISCQVGAPACPWDARGPSACRLKQFQRCCIAWEQVGWLQADAAVCAAGGALLAHAPAGLSKRCALRAGLHAGPLPVFTSDSLASLNLMFNQLTGKAGRLEPGR